MSNKKDEKEVILGVNEETYNKTQQPYVKSETVKNAESEAETNKSNFNNVASNKNIISNNVKKTINSTFKTPSAVTEADTYLKKQLSQIQSGKTSYSDQIKSMMEQITNREKFSYDVDTDPLFQQALASAMNSGKQAMQDTIGQASALTGGYGSSYATSAANQSYNAFIEDAYDNLPQYYQMAMEAYQMEGDEMYRQLAMYNDADSKEYDRMVTAYDATSQYRNRLYDEAYSIHRDTKSDAFAMANLQLNENSQLVDNAYKMYQVSSDYADKMYEREYTSWVDSINMAWKEVEALNTDAWNTKNFDEGVRQYEKSFAEDVRQFDMNYAQNEDHFTRTQQFQASEAQKDRDFQASENAKNRAVKSSSGSGSGSGGSGYYASKDQKTEALDAYINGGYEGLAEYVDSQKGGMNTEELMQYVESQAVPTGTKITKTKNTWNGIFGLGGLTGHIDTNDEYLVEYPGEEAKTVKAADLPESIRSRIDNLKEGKSIIW